MPMENEHAMTKPADVIDKDFTIWELEMTENMRGEKVPKGAYTRLGTFKEALQPYYEDDKQYDEKFKKAWTGLISVANRPEITEEIVEQVLNPDSLDHYYVRASDKAPSRCIDGRCVCNYNETADTTDIRELGPQNPGGTVAAALCARVAAWDSMFTEQFSLVEDIHYLNEVFSRIGFTVGGHIDDNAEGNKTGCGAIDKIPGILERSTNPVAQKQIRKMTKMMLGDYYSQETVDSILGRLLSLQGMADEYFVRDEEGDYLFRKDTIDTLRTLNPKGVEQLGGAHKEIALVINLVKGATFHRDQFSLDNDHEVQMFNYDFWKSIELAEKLYPVDTDDEIKNKMNGALRTRYITVRALFAVGTAMILTDGSLELVVRQTQELQEAS